MPEFTEPIIPEVGCEIWGFPVYDAADCPMYDSGRCPRSCELLEDMDTEVEDGITEADFFRDEFLRK